MPLNARIPDPDRDRIAIIGLGYVGLPLATEFGRIFHTVGFDIDASRVDELNGGQDRTHEVAPDALRTAGRLTLSAQAQCIDDCNVYIVTVPTPIDGDKQPDLRPLLAACETIGPRLGAGDLVIFESTVFPGATTGICGPLLERTSGLVCDDDFFLGYSPERINPGDKARRLPDIVKVTAGSTPEAAHFVDSLYGRIVTAGTCPVSSIEVAEAAKVIENTQRDLNIALINELSMIFHKLGIDTTEVLDAASTKWNFLPFRPGLVGGHCIGVDPYYLTHRALQVGHHPEIILSGRRINDSMGSYVARRVVKLMAGKKIPIANSRVLMLGLTFKENCPDLRNSRVIDIIDELTDFHIAVDVHDPWVSPAELAKTGLQVVQEPEAGRYDAIVLAVAHRQFQKMGAESIHGLGKDNHVLFDLKSLFARNESDGRL